MKALARNAYRLIRDAFRYTTFGYSRRRGVYQSFAEAEAAAPGKRIGYNHRDLALEFGAELNLRLDSSEYPVLFHLERIMKSQCTVLDFGGNVGTHYLRYKEHLDTDRVDWIVCDLPEITKVGRELCNGMSNVSFIIEFDEISAAGIGIFLACDSLQYAGVASPDILLRKLIEKGNRPAHVLLDQLPLYEREQFVTLQNGGLVRYPHHVYNRTDFIGAIADLGYDLIDHWESRCDSCVIPFHPEKTVRAYTGLCFSDNW